MKAVIQRCKRASVTVDGQVISSIGAGLMVLVGIGLEDTAADQATIVKRLLSVRLFPDETGAAWKKNVVDAGLEVLCVSQFTLMATLKKGAKPDFRGALTADLSRKMYESFLDDMRAGYQSDKIKDGRFGAMMDVELVNDGPVTILLDSKESAASTSGASTPVDPKQARKEIWANKLKEKAAKDVESKKLGDELAKLSVAEETTSTPPPAEGV
ncbi:hypothetical protein MNV49_006912 [Pseudohyphozyma bogoriensis]|nr:hypothetical protein MNV49_006912 [Pseudohyphozyma bogoriensis]